MCTLTSYSCLEKSLKLRVSFSSFNVSCTALQVKFGFKMQLTAHISQSVEGNTKIFRIWYLTSPSVSVIWKDLISVRYCGIPTHVCSLHVSYTIIYGIVRHLVFNIRYLKLSSTHLSNPPNPYSNHTASKVTATTVITLSHVQSFAIL